MRGISSGCVRRVCVSGGARCASVSHGQALAMVVEYDAPASVELCSAGRVHATTSCVEYTVPVPDAIVVPTPAWCTTTAPAAEYISQGVAQVQV